MVIDGMEYTSCKEGRNIFIPRMEDLEMLKSLEISQSGLERARDTNDNEWLNSTFCQAEEVIKSGGSVHLTQRFSDDSKELVGIIDTLELLDYYRRKYQRE